MTKHNVWILPMVLGSFVCSVMLALVTIGIAQIEFHQAKWTHIPRELPAIANIFRTVYPAGWLLPIMTAFIGLLIFSEKLKQKTTIACLISIMAIVHLGWFLFWLLSLYLTNQSFIS